MRCAPREFAFTDLAPAPPRTSSPNTSRSHAIRARHSSHCRKTTRSPRSTSNRRRSARCAPLGYKDYDTRPHAAATLRVDGSTVDRLNGGRTEAAARRLLGPRVRGRDRRRQAQVHHPHGSRTERRADRRQPAVPVCRTFNPRIVRFTLDPDRRRVRTDASRSRCDARTGSRLTGLPNTAISADGNQPYNDEVPVDLFGKVLAARSAGRRFRRRRGCGRTARSGWRTSIAGALSLQLPRGGLIERLIPIGTHAAAGSAGARRLEQRALFGTEALPAVLAQRRQNRGFEAIVDPERQDLRIRAEPAAQPSVAQQCRAERDAERAHR